MMRRRRRGPAADQGLDILSAGPSSTDGTPAGRTTPGGRTTTVVDEAELLSTPATSDDLDAALAVRPRRARLPRLTVLLAAAVLIGGGFLGGIEVGKQSASASTTGFPGGGGLPSLAGAAGSGGFPGGGGAPTGGSGASAARGFGGFGGANGTFGTIKLVDGSTIYVTSASGGIIRVTTSPSTKIQITAAGQVKDLRPGETVTVQGVKHGSGLVAASSVTESGLSTGGG
jgi:hypothetical protein